MIPFFTVATLGLAPCNLLTSSVAFLSCLRPNHPGIDSSTRKALDAIDTSGISAGAGTMLVTLSTILMMCPPRTLVCYNGYNICSCYNCSAVRLHPTGPEPGYENFYPVK